VNIQDLVAAESVEALKGFVLGEVEDLKAFAQEISADFIRAAKEGRADITKELGHQIEALAEAKRLKAKGFAWDQLLKIVLSIARVAVQAMDLKEKLS
jgi:hypothetical protein